MSSLSCIIFTTEYVTIFQSVTMALLTPFLKKNEKKKSKFQP